jgi:HAD-hyrolase-like
MDDLYSEGAKLPEHVYMVGDNPASDICGGNAYGWNRCIVRTGVYQGPPGSNDENNPASCGVFDDVLKALTIAIRRELGKEFFFEWDERESVGRVTPMGAERDTASAIELVESRG